MYKKLAKYDEPVSGFLIDRIFDAKIYKKNANIKRFRFASLFNDTKIAT